MNPNPGEIVFLIAGFAVITPAIVFYITWDPRDSKFINMKNIAEYNLKGSVWPFARDYAAVKEEGEAHLLLHQKKAEHSDGKPFYCNTFTGWRKHYYNMQYKRIARKNQKEFEQKALIAKKVGNLSLERQLNKNTREVKN